jgi:hypothetical protein
LRAAGEVFVDLLTYKNMLSALPPLSKENLRRDQRDCKICGGSAAFFDVVDFNKFCSVSDYYAFGRSGIPVCYWRCVDCGLVFTEFFDTWASEDFARWVYNSDYALVDAEYLEVRPALFSGDVGRRLRGLESIAILDYGSGAGTFSERMRGQGFAGAENFDPYSSPTRPAGPFDLLTCFEVLEHSVDPVATVEDMKGFLKADGCILFSQALQPSGIMEIRANWWYVAPRNGHASIYTLEALVGLARRVGMMFCGREGLFMFHTAQACEVTQRLLLEFGPTVISLRLQSPGSSGAVVDDDFRVPQWHGLESTHQGAFRWSACATITWDLGQLPCYPCDLLVTIPLLMRAYPAVLNGATLRAGAQSALVTVTNTEIRARISVPDASVREISLCTMNPCSPAELRGEVDRRPLGIAVLACAADVA